jgi:hypothetical protein
MPNCPGHLVGDFRCGGSLPTYTLDACCLASGRRGVCSQLQIRSPAKLKKLARSYRNTAILCRSSAHNVIYRGSSHRNLRAIIHSGFIPPRAHRPASQSRTTCGATPRSLPITDRQGGPHREHRLVGDGTEPDTGPSKNAGGYDTLESGAVMLSRDRLSALIPNLNSAAAAISIRMAATA